MDVSFDSYDNDTVLDRRHLQLAWSNSFSFVVTHMWERAKRCREAIKDEEQLMELARYASISSELARRRGFPIVN
jgi:hypothetical protein